jgi:hypothetical protein
MGRARRIALLLVASLLLAATAAAATAEIRVKPTRVYPGEVVRVFGNVNGGCATGDQVTLISRAFSPRHEFAGVPAIFATRRADGRFSKRTRIPSGRNPGRYRISGRCGGGNLGVTARLRVLAERHCADVRVDRDLNPSAGGSFGAFPIRTRRTRCGRARRLASRYVREPADDPLAPRRIGHWRCTSRAAGAQVVRVRCSLGARRVSFRDHLPSG